VWGPQPHPPALSFLSAAVGSLTGPRATDFINNATSAAGAAGVTTKATLDATHYCVYAQVGNWFAYKLNPAGVILETTDPTKVCT
jgi:hypothetical protein